MARKKTPRRRLWKIALALPIAALVALAIWELFFLRISALADRNHSRTLTVPVGEQERDLVVGPANARWTPLGRVSPEVTLCVVAAEDARFWQHDGFDWKELRNSLERNLEEKEFARGGSTITMQLAKNLFLWREKSLVRKLFEAYLTWRLEHTLEKRRILELYLNVVEWGPGVYGIGEASRYYFGKPPSDVSLGEAALLAVTLPNPIRWNPKRAPGFALGRQQELLGRLRRENLLDRLPPDRPLAER